MFQRESFHLPIHDYCKRLHNGETNVKIGSDTIDWIGKVHAVQNAAKIDVETKIIGTQIHGEGRDEKIKVQTVVNIFENQRDDEVAEANDQLATKKAGWAQLTQLAEFESFKVMVIKEVELQREVELKNALTQTEKLKDEYF